MTTRTITAETLLTAQADGLVRLRPGLYLEAVPDCPFACALGTLGLLENLFISGVQLNMGIDSQVALLVSGLMQRGFSPSYIAGLDDGFELLPSDPEAWTPHSAWERYHRHTRLNLGQLDDAEYQAGHAVGLAVRNGVEYLRHK